MNMEFKVKNDVQKRCLSHFLKLHGEFEDFERDVDIFARWSPCFLHFADRGRYPRALTFYLIRRLHNRFRCGWDPVSYSRERRKAFIYEAFSGIIERVSWSIWFLNEFDGSFAQLNETSQRLQWIRQRCNHADECNCEQWCYNNDKDCQRTNVLSGKVAPYECWCADLRINTHRALPFLRGHLSVDNLYRYCSIIARNCIHRHDCSAGVFIANAARFH